MAGQVKQYIPLQVLEFNSMRKCMSIMHHDQQGHIMLYFKGAGRIWAWHQTMNLSFVRRHQRKWGMFLNGGLRMLCIAYQCLSDNKYRQWSIRTMRLLWRLRTVAYALQLQAKIYKPVISLTAYGKSSNIASGCLFAL